MADYDTSVPNPLTLTWQMLPPEVRQQYASGARSFAELMGELSPGAAVRDTVEGIGDTTKSLLAGEGWSTATNLAKTAGAAVGVIPGSKFVGQGVKKVTQEVAGLLAPLGARTAIEGGILKTMPDGSIIKTFPEIRDFARGEAPAYVRWSSGPKFDMRPGARSRNQVTGNLEPGLSANLLKGDDDVQLLKQLREYEFLRANGGDINPHLYQGRVVGAGGDTEPVIAPTRYLGSLSGELQKTVLDDATVRRLQLQDYIGRNEAMLQRSKSSKWFTDTDRLERELAQYRDELSRLGGPFSW